MNLKYIKVSPPLKEKQTKKLQNMQLGIALSSWLNGLGSPVCKHLFSAEPKLYCLPFPFVWGFVSMRFFVCFQIKQNFKQKSLAHWENPQRTWQEF